MAGTLAGASLVLASIFLCGCGGGAKADTDGTDTDGAGADRNLGNKCADSQGFVAPPQPGSLQGPNSTVYFGCGCFWHLQHEFVTRADECIHGRPDTKLTSFAGYAGSDEVGAGNKVCYHNLNSVADYGDLGHAEVVSLDLAPAVAESVFELFLTSICVKGVRKDLQDAGSEYRSLVGFPGGLHSALGKQFADVAKAHDVAVAAGQGGDADMGSTSKVWVMDTAEFPFHQAELYHQFHDDMVDRYGTAYAQLKQGCIQEGKLTATGCPSDAVTNLRQVGQTQ